jgi:hypothetical protein
MRWKPFAAGAIAGGLAALAAVAATSGARQPPEAAQRPAPATAEFPGGHPIDAAQVASGKLSFERMPAEVTSALQMHSDEIVKTAQLVETRQVRITGACAPGSAIRVVQKDGSVVCQRLPRGVVSVSALSGVARRSDSHTTQGAVPGAVGRYQTGGEEDFLVVPIQLPDGAIVTGFSFSCWDASPKVDGAAYLYRSDDVLLATLALEGAREEVRTVSTESIQNQRVENGPYAYFVYMRISPLAAGDLMPVSASVSYRMP